MRLVIVLLVACHGDATKICTKASAKYQSCVKELLGSEAEQFVAGKEDIAGCARDDKTVAMYQKCLAETDCTKFQDCLTDYASATAPSVASNLPRTAQCEQHVKDGLRAIANQIVVLGEIEKRGDAAKHTAQSCVLDESKPWADCITAAERAEAQRYGTERQKECETWEPELAACIFHQPNAKRCDPDSQPMWRLPREQGATGPRVAWSIDVAANSEGDPFIAWTPDHAVVVQDDDGVRLVRDGKVAWTTPVAGKHPVLAGNYLLASREGSAVKLDLATRSLQTLNLDARAFAVTGKTVLANNDESELFEFTPATCTKPTCAKKVGRLDDAAASETLDVWHDDIVTTTSSSLLVSDRHGKVKLELSFSEDNNEAILAGDDVLIDDSKGVAILSLAGCLAHGAKVEVASTRAVVDGCVIASNPASWTNTITPTALPGGAVAYNDHGIVERTHCFGPGITSWAIETGGTGPVVGDASFVYAVTLGLDDKGPARLLALDRKTGHVAWHTDLVATPPERAHVTLTLRDKQLAVGVGSKLYGVELP